jgi:hypothetical protein
MTRRISAATLLLVLAPLLVLVGESGPVTAASTASTDGGVPPATSTVPTVCRTPARKGFWPTRANVQHVARRVPVLAMGRYGNGIPKPPPLTTSGKRSFGWDRKGPKPGSHRGNVRFNAHTYPDGSALGNALLRGLKVGDRIIVRGSTKAICYKVTRRISVRPRSWAARVGYYSTTGPPKLAIVVCSGTRLGPGNWTRRTIWYARPSTS